MKTKKCIVTMLAIAIAIIASATEKPKTNVQSLNANQVLVTVEANRATEMEISILDETGSIVYYKKTRKPLTRINKIYDVENLGNGNYSLELKVGNLVSERELTVTNSKIIVSKPREFSIPYFAFNGENLIISYLNFDNEKFRLEVYNDRRLVYKTKIENETPLNKGFDFSKLEAGNYQVVLNSINKNFSYNFEK
jgi:hypothetical protein